MENGVETTHHNKWLYQKKGILFACYKIESKTKNLFVNKMSRVIA